MLDWDPEDSKFTGYEHLERWMVLPRSGAALRCVPAGIALRPPTGEAHASAYARACSTAGVTDDLLPVRQLDGVDTEDRVEKAAKLSRELVAAGL